MKQEKHIHKMCCVLHLQFSADVIFCINKIIFILFKYPFGEMF